MEIGHGHWNGMGVAQVSCPNERERLTEHAKSQTSQKIKKRKKKRSVQSRGAEAQPNQCSFRKIHADLFLNRKKLHSVPLRHNIL